MTRARANSASTISSKIITDSRQQCCANGKRVSAARPHRRREWLKGYADAGVSDLIVRFTGDHERQLEAVSGLRGQLGW